MSQGEKLITGPMEEPVTLPEMKTHLKLALSFTDEDTYIGGLISAARAEIERISRRALLTQTWEQYLDVFPHHDGMYNRSLDKHCIHLLHPPLQSVVSVKYLDPGGTLQTMPPSDYVVDTGSKPGRIAPKIGVPWPPTTHALPQAVTIQFVAGYADTAEEAIAADPSFNADKLLIMHLTGHWYFNREPVVAGQVASLPMHLQGMALGRRF